MNTKRTSNLPLICLICGDVARGINFDVMSCMSCKTFFRRHAFKAQINLRCELHDDCEITVRTRSGCSSCRLKKCFTLGMKSRSIGKCISTRIKIKKPIIARKNQLPQPLPISLLQKDRSLLTSEEWNILSNINHAYDALNVPSQMKFLLDEQSSLPCKIRSKASTTFNIIKLLYSSLQPFVERSPYSQTLSTDALRQLIQRNSSTFGTLNALFVMREVDAFSHLSFSTGCNVAYGYEVMVTFLEFLSRFERNNILVKIMLMILAYSTNCSIVFADCSEDPMSSSTSLSIFHIQNIFITMLWKYLNYQYGYNLAVKWLDSFVKYVLDTIQSINDRPNEQHSNLVDEIVEETTHSLIISD